MMKILEIRKKQDLVARLAESTPVKITSLSPVPILGEAGMFVRCFSYAREEKSGDPTIIGTPGSNALIYAVAARSAIYCAYFLAFKASKELDELLPVFQKFQDLF